MVAMLLGVRVEGGLLSSTSRFRLVPNKVCITDPELTAPSGLYVFFWTIGVDIEGDFIP